MYFTVHYLLPSYCTSTSTVEYFKIYTLCPAYGIGGLALRLPYGAPFPNADGPKLLRYGTTTIAASLTPVDHDPSHATDVSELERLVVVLRHAWHASGND